MDNLTEAEPLTWSGAESLTWAGAGPRAGGAGPHLSCSNPRPTRPPSAAGADAEPAAARTPGAPPPPAGTSGTALGCAEVPASRWSCGAGCHRAWLPGSGRVKDMDQESFYSRRSGFRLFPKGTKGLKGKQSWAGVGERAGEETEAGRGRPA